mgnify:CR=1 FL=1
MEVSCIYRFFSTFTNNSFVIKLDNYDGEPIIPKKLYDVVREEFLPYDRVLLKYFIGVFSVAIFAYFLFILISLFRTSGFLKASKRSAPSLPRRYRLFSISFGGKIAVSQMRLTALL